MAGSSSRQKYPSALHNEPRPFLVAGSFETNSTNAPANARGRGYTVARTAVGTFTLTFPDKYSQLVSAVGSVQSTAENDAYVEFGDYDSSTGVLTIRVMGAATNGEIELDGPRVNFQLVFQIQGGLAKTFE